MTPDAPHGAASSDTIDEPASTAHRAVEAGSSRTAPRIGGDLTRAVVCALLVGIAVASPTSALVLAPFVPALVAIRVLRDRRGARRFVAMVTGGAVAAALASLGSLPGAAASAVAFALAMALALAPGLGAAHARAARRDPVVVDPEPWPEPLLRSGFTPVLGAWLLAVLVVCASAAPLVDSVAALERDQVRDGYSLYVRECRDGGAFAAREEFCANVLAQRDDALDLVDDHAYDLLAVLVAVVAFGGAATAHLVVLGRARRAGAAVRPAWRLRELEVHWSAAYLVAVGLGGWMLAGDGGGAAEVGRAAGVLVGSVGALLVVAQGLGLAAWVLTRGRTPGWYRAFLLLAALFVVPVTLVVVFVLGVFDLALHPRRRALRSASLPDRGSGS